MLIKLYVVRVVTKGLPENLSFENVQKFKHFETTVTNGNIVYIYAGTETKIKPVNSCCTSYRNFYSSDLFARNQN